MGRLGRTIIVLGLAVSACWTPSTEAAGRSQDAAPRATVAGTPLLSMTVDTRRVRHRRKLPQAFLGFSTEFPLATRVMGSPATGVNPVADGLFANIRAAGSGGPALRVGGSSAEQAWWNPTHGPRPLGIRFDADRDYLQYLRAFALRNSSPLALTLNLVSSDPGAAVEYARAALSILAPGAVRSFELGNEPDTYSSMAYYTDAGGSVVKQRPAGYAVANYLREFSARAQALRAQLGPVPLVGPSACCAQPFIDALPAFLAQERTRVARASLHEYFGAACSSIKPGTPAYPTRSKLLGPDDMNRIIGGFRTAVRQSARVGKKVELTETNSFACGGQPGVSDTFTSALWGAEYLMRTAGVGVVGANLHAFGRAYSPFDFDFKSGRGWRGTARPLYYGALLFSRATADRATLLLDPVSRGKARPGSNAVAFPTLAGNRLRVMVLAKGSKRGGVVTIAVPRGAQVAALTRLSARGLGAKSGVKLAGQAVASGSRTGLLTGRVKVAGVRRHDGAYSFRMPAAGGALLSLRVRR